MVWKAAICGPDVWEMGICIQSGFSPAQLTEWAHIIISRHWMDRCFSEPYELNTPHSHLGLNSMMSIIQQWVWSMGVVGVGDTYKYFVSSKYSASISATSPWKRLQGVALIRYSKSVGDVWRAYTYMRYFGLYINVNPWRLFTKSDQVIYVHLVMNRSLKIHSIAQSWHYVDLKVRWTPKVFVCL